MLDQRAPPCLQEQIRQGAYSFMDAIWRHVSNDGRQTIFSVLSTVTYTV
jgi:hypothetical protein